VFSLVSGNSTDSWLSAILVIGRLIVFGRIFIVLIVRMCALIDFSLEFISFSWVNLLFSWKLNVCCCVARVTAFDDVSFVDLVLCSFVFELLYRGQRSNWSTWSKVGGPVSGPVPYQCMDSRSSESVWVDRSPTKSAPTLVFRQSQCTFFLLIGVPSIRCVYSNLASVYMLISRWNQPLLRWDFVAARALVALRAKN